MKKNYEAPELELVKFTLTDVILASITEDVGGGGDPGGGGEFGDDGEFGGEL